MEAVRTGERLPVLTRLCSRIYVMNLGALITEAQPEEIRQNPGVRKAYLGAAV